MPVKPFLSFIIPAYNESERIQESLDKINEFFSKQEYTSEIIVIDDGSDDNTIEVLKKNSFVKIISQGKNKGKGAAVKRGMLEANGEIRLFSDADLSTPVYETNKLLEGLNNGFDVCIGSRALDYSSIKKHQPFYREFMGKFFNKIVQTLVIKGIQDTQCGFKAFKAKAATEIFNDAQIEGFGFDVEILYLAGMKGYKVKEVSVEWYNDERSKINPITDSAKMFQEVLKVRRLHK
jgi:dolichyl-phosphate beta-glucosyltransferase